MNAWPAPNRALLSNEIRELTAQFFVTLEASFAKVQGQQPPRSPEAYERVKALLDPQEPTRSWKSAYAVEQLLVHLFDDDTLANELQVRVREAKGSLKPAQADYYAAEADKAAMSATARRALLSRLVNDLQWRYTVDEVKRGYTQQITLRTGQLFMMSMLVFAASVLVTLAVPGLLQFDVRLLVPAVLAGCWGASFSMLSSLKDRLDASNLDALKVMRARWVLASRVLIGAGGASILYFFFVSGLVTGAAFPDLMNAARQPTDKPPPLDVFAMLEVWCFIAGFSERLIPGLLAKTESKLNPADTQDRYRPEPTGTDAPTPTPTSAPPATDKGPG